MSGERNERSEKGNEEERRLTERTSEDEAQRNETTPYKDKNTWCKFAPGENRLAPGANLACGGNGLASDASFCS